MLKEKILNRRPGIVTYGLTPPKAVNSQEKLKKYQKSKLRE